MPETHTDTKWLRPGDKFAGLGRRGEDRGAPPQRDRDPGPSPHIGEKFERYETISFTLAAVGTVQDAGQFSGRPDAIDMFASAANVDVFLTDELGREESAIRLPVATWIYTQLSKRRIRVQDATATGLQVCRFVGKYASRGE
jgi:hypothetical protein